jgi:hypothetical protein
MRGFFLFIADFPWKAAMNKKKVFVAPEAVCHSLNNLDLVVDSFDVD